MIRNLSSIFGFIIILLTIYHDFTVRKMLSGIKDELS